jgi:hypothetical protein
MLRGAPYCAGCWPFYVKLAESPVSSTVFTEPAPPEAARDTNHQTLVGLARTTVPAGCDCCGRELGGTNQTIEGFRLCAACLGQDVELALKIAKARHQRRLQELALQFQGSTNDGK